jgi:DNA-binding LytR/AlgR family response regulator
MGRPKTYKKAKVTHGKLPIGGTHGKEDIDVHDILYIENISHICYATTVDGKKQHCSKSITEVIADHGGLGIILIDQSTAVNINHVPDTLKFDKKMIEMPDGNKLAVGGNYQKIFDEINEENDYNFWKKILVHALERQ